LGERQLAVIEEKLSVVRRQLSVEKPSTADMAVAAASLTQAQEATRALKAMSTPFLNWAGKAERLSFDVPTLPLFVHERLSTKAIIETLTSHKRDKQIDMFSLFGDPQHSFTDQILRAYEYQDKWVNRMVLGDSLVVMNSLLHYEGLGGQVQMIYMDPPYGVKFGSNFQPFIRKRDVSHNDDEEMTREPEMVQAYRDTWELGLHSYLTYLRDRLLLARDLLAPNGSVFVQISDENVHHVREVMDEVFGADNFVSLICFQKTGGASTKLLASTVDYLVWYSRDIERIKYRQLYVPRETGDTSLDRYDQVLLPDGTSRRLTPDEIAEIVPLPSGKRYQLTSLLSDGQTTTPTEFEFQGTVYRPRAGSHWKTSVGGSVRLASLGRIEIMGSILRYRRFVDDFAVIPLADRWESTQVGVGLTYVVQTSTQVVQRCVLLSTDPGDLVLDPTCGSGTTAYVAEQWGRRWITIDTSRVPLARQRLLTATFPWYELNDNARGPAGGFVYKRKQNNKGEEVGGIVPHVTLKSIANNEPPEEEVLVDRPETDNKITRVTGPFCVEGTIPTPVALSDDEFEIKDSKDEQIQDSREGAIEDSRIPDSRRSAIQDSGEATFTDRMLEILRKSPLLRLEGNRTLALKNIRPPAKTLSLSAEALVDATASVGAGLALPEGASRDAQEGTPRSTPTTRPVALVFGPENGAISERLVQEAAKEAWLKNYAHLYVIGFAIQPNARQLIENCDAVVGIPATYIQATPDLLMGDLLKNMRSSQIFSVCGLPEIKIHRRDAEAQRKYQVELLGLDVFDPVTMEADHRSGNDVPAWFLDTDYNGLCFHVSQAFFPRTSAWDNLKKALKSEFEESVWDHLSGTTSAAFEAGENRQIAVKVIDDRGNELMVVEKLG
jgi:adenine-specific DNA-methyltransferase